MFSNKLKKKVSVLELTHPSVDRRKMHNLEVSSKVLFGDLTEDYRPGDSLSGSSEELLQRAEGGARMYRRIGLEKKCT